MLIKYKVAPIQKCYFTVKCLFSNISGKYGNIFNSKIIKILFENGFVHIITSD